MKIDKYEAFDFTKESILSLKNNKKVYVVFSTFGEREADLIYSKITLLQNEIGEIIDKIFLSHRRVSNKQEKTEIKAKEADSGIEILVCNDYKVQDMQNEKGKGADMRRTLYHINKNFNGSNLDSIVVFLDTDVVTKYFGSHFVLGLVGAVLKGADFSKASFWREMGRVKKFVAQPLFSVIDNPKINNLTEFNYPLSGEVAGTIDFFNSVNFWQIYGVETGISIDALCNEYKIADVNLGKYDHEHSSDENIQKMAFGIMRTYLKQLIDYDIIKLSENSKISDVFKACYIDEDSKRKNFEYDLTEIKYKPLKDIL